MRKTQLKIIKVQRFLWLIVVTCFVMGIAILPVAAERIPLLEFKFNDTGTEAPSTGHDTTPLIMIDMDENINDLYSQDAAGVSRGAGDRALDLTSSEGMGADFWGGRAEQPEPLVSIADGLVSFTFCAWYKTASSEPFGRAAKLATYFDGGGGFIVSGENDGRISLTVGGSGGIVEAFSTDTVSIITEEWVFVAVTYDGTSTVDNVKFYVGTATSSVVQAGGEVTLGAGMMANCNSPDTMTVGNFRNGPTRPFHGYIDNVRLFGSSADASGVLTLDELEALRRLDVDFES